MSKNGLPNVLESFSKKLESYHPVSSDFSIVKNSDGSVDLFGVIKDITFEVQELDFSAEDVNPSQVDFITLDIEGVSIYVYPYSQVFDVERIPDFFKKLIEMSGKYLAFITVHKYGNFFFAFDYDLYNALFLDVKKGEVVKSGLQ